MATGLSDSERVELVRRGNELYNAGRIEEAKPLFLKAHYTDGIVRVADHYYYRLKRPAAALLLYRHAGCRERVEQIYETIAAVIRRLLEEDRRAEAGEDPPGNAD
jgi:hypothetical protein